MRRMEKLPRYLPQGDYVPHGWPQGTGITLSRTASTPEDRMAVAAVLSNFGCRPEIALHAADEILGEGSYSTRVRTRTAICRNLADDLAAIGVTLEFEVVIPEGNDDHALSPQNQRDEVRSKRYPGDVRALLEEAARAAELAAPSPVRR